MKSGLQTISDNTEDLMRALEYLRDTKVMIGIPDSKAGRSDGPASNAVIGYVQETGLPEHNLPPRPFLIPGVQGQKQAITDSFEAAGKAALVGDKETVKNIYTRMGLRCVNAVRKVIDDQQFSPLAPSTLEARFAKISSKEQRKILQDQITPAERAAGINNVLARIRASIKILIDTGAMRTSITFVLRTKGKDS